MNLYEWLKANNQAGFTVDGARLKRAGDIRSAKPNVESKLNGEYVVETTMNSYACLLYTSDAADERSSVDLGGRRIIKKKNKYKNNIRRNKYKHNTTKRHTRI